MQLGRPNNNPASPFIGNAMAAAIVDGSVAQNVNPFLVVAIGEHESGLANPGPPVHYAPGSYNAFGRMAGPGQPYVAAPAGVMVREYMTGTNGLRG